MAEVLTFGETMMVLNPETTGPLRHVPAFRKSIGGAESNVAVGLCRLGHTAAWVSKASADPVGDYVLTTIRGEGVDVTHVVQTDGFTGLILKERPGLGDPNVFFYRKGAAASTMQPAEFPLVALDGVRILHATGIFPALSPNCLATSRLVFREAKARGLAISFDPNMRRKLWTEAEARPVMRELAARADILLPGLDEGELLAGPGTPEAIVERLLELGPQIVALKLGPDGALVGVRGGGRPTHVPGTPLTPVDTVGAGDAFAAAFLAFTLEGAPAVAAAAMGCAAGALATQVLGDIEGLPLRADLERLAGGRAPVTR
ncbi:MAG TPA: sugar kinase [Symbiobacteriaceae bacterium]